MTASHSGLVEIAREFLVTHELMRRLFGRYRDASLRFEELEDLVGDGERSVLFRLKERCHARFRSRSEEATPLHREALLDLTVGSLFHEAMKFRENFYQREVYGPRVEALRSRSGTEETPLFDEFARIQEGVSARLEEGLAESEALLEQTLDQLFALLAAHRDDPLVARLLVDRATDVEAALDRPVSDVLAEIYGDAATGFLRAGRSLLESGYYPQAVRALECSAASGGDRREVERLVAYARGMQAYLAGDYGESVARLADWADRSEPGRSELTGLAHDAVARIGQLAQGPDRERVSEQAAVLLTRFGGARKP